MIHKIFFGVWLSLFFAFFPGIYATMAPVTEATFGHLNYARDYGLLFTQSVNNIDIFSTSHVIPHIRALVPCPGLTSEVCVVASTSVPLTPTEILNLYFCRPTEILSEYFPRASGT